MLGCGKVLVGGFYSVNRSQLYNVDNNNNNNNPGAYSVSQLKIHFRAVFIN